MELPVIKLPVKWRGNMVIRKGIWLWKEIEPRTNPAKVHFLKPTMWKTNLLPKPTQAWNPIGSTWISIIVIPPPYLSVYWLSHPGRFITQTTSTTQTTSITQKSITQTTSNTHTTSNTQTTSITQTTSNTQTTRITQTASNL